MARYFATKVFCRYKIAWRPDQQFCSRRKMAYGSSLGSSITGGFVKTPISLESAPVTSDVLRSWKEIAAYLHCAVRTAQRWEAELGMPIHRLRAQRRDAVFARRKELDEWLRRAFAEKEAMPGMEALSAEAILDRACLDLVSELELLRLRLAMRKDRGNRLRTASLIEMTRAKVHGSIPLMHESENYGMLSCGEKAHMGAAWADRAPAETPAQEPLSCWSGRDPEAARPRFLLLTLEFGLSLVDRAKVVMGSNHRETAQSAIGKAWRAVAIVLKFRDRLRLDETTRARLNVGLDHLRSSLNSLQAGRPSDIV